MNEVLPDGMVRIDQCSRRIYMKTRSILVQETCEAEPRVDLIASVGMAGTGVRLDVIEATHLRDALNSFLADSTGPVGWQFAGVTFDLGRTWAGRVEPFLGTYWHFTGRYQHGMPMMQPVGQIADELGDDHPFSLILGLEGETP